MISYPSTTLNAEVMCKDSSQVPISRITGDVVFGMWMGCPRKIQGNPDSLVRHQNVQDVCVTYRVRNLPLRTEFLTPSLFPAFPNSEPAQLCRPASAAHRLTAPLLPLIHAVSPYLS